MKQPLSREARLDALTSGTFDVLVIGGGITGAGVALDAASRGYRTALVDKGDWASGTSSKSSKLIHGGLRYLQQKEYRLVYENLRERQRLLKNAPHLVQVMPFLIPLFGKGGVASKTVAKGYATALRLYDLTGGVRIGKRYERLSVEQTVKHMGGLQSDRVVAGFLYYDAQADDARLTMAVVRTAENHGATTLNYAPVASLVTEEGKVGGAVLADGSTVRARCVVNATGVWAAEVGAMTGDPSYRIRPAKGIHITVPYAKIRSDIAAVVPVRKDKRSVFVVPAYDCTPSADGPPDKIYIGTTDTDYDGPLDDPTCTPEDIQYVLDGMNDWLEDPLTLDDVLATWAGLRPLLSDARSERTADLSRRHKVDRSSTGLVSILGGKLTTYRQMAEDTVDEVNRLLGEKRPCRTQRLRLHGAEDASAAVLPAGLPVDTVAGLQRRHGQGLSELAAIIASRPELAAPLLPGLSYIQAEVVHAARFEQALHVDDILCRRTRAMLLDRHGTRAAIPTVASLLGDELGWDAEQRRAEEARMRAIVDAEEASEHRQPVPPSAPAGTPSVP